MNEDGSKARGVIAVIVAINFFAVVGVLIFASPRPDVEKYLILLIGALITAQAQVLNFYFGSSSGSKQLAATQSDLVRTAVAPLTQATSTLAGAAPTGTPDDPVAVKEVKPGFEATRPL